MILWLLNKTLAAAGDEEVQCDVYMANSTIPNAGLGIFTSLDLKIGDPVGNGDVCIPIIDLDFHHEDTYNPFSDYVWYVLGQSAANCDWAS